MTSSAGTVVCSGPLRSPTGHAHLVLTRSYRRNCNIPAEKDFYVVCSMKSTHAKRWTQSTTNFECYGQVVKVVVKVVELTQCRRSWTATATIDADVRCCRRRIDNPVTAFLWYRRRYCTTTRYQLRPVADLTAPTTSRHRRPDAWLRGSVNTSSSPMCRWPAGPTTCRRLRHINDATVSWRHVASRRSVRYHVDTCLPSTTTILCRHRELATPSGYAGYIFSCMLIFFNFC